VGAILEREAINMAGLLERGRELCLGFGRTPYWFRGHSIADWHLVPSVHRDYDNLSERNLMGRFRMGAPTRNAKVPDIGDLGSWICLMQHFGLPTRLLDWTGSLLVAVYFAVVFDRKPGPAAVWILVPSELNKAMLGVDHTCLVHGPEIRPLLSSAFDGTLETDQVLAALGQDVDLRMTVQQGAFTVHGDASPLESRVGAERYLAKIVIPESAKSNFDDELWFLGIRRATLFPDLANLAKDLAEDWRLIPKRSTGA
jgi:hypothetical protein